MRCLVLILILFSSQFSVAADFVGVTKDEFEDHYQSQDQLLWCWASSAEMVLAHKGVKIPQGEIVQRIKGAKINATAGIREILATVNGVLPTANGGSVVVSGQFVRGAPAPTVLYNQLSNGDPVILMYRRNDGGGHAVVLTGADAKITKDRGVFIERFHVFDPFSYRRVFEGGGSYWEQDSSLEYQTYQPKWGPWGLRINPGLITGMILIDGTSF